MEKTAYACVQVKHSGHLPLSTPKTTCFAFSEFLTVSSVSAAPDGCSVLLLAQLWDVGVDWGQGAAPVPGMSLLSGLGVMLVLQQQSEICLIKIQAAIHLHTLLMSSTVYRLAWEQVTEKHFQPRGK